jgi:hypothetical protein
VTPNPLHEVRKMTDHQSTIVMEEVTDPQRIAEAHARRERFDRNWGWLRAHAQEVYKRYRGKCISVAGEELFVGDTPQEVIARAAAAHPEDDGSFVHYIPLKKMARVYGNS